MKKSIKYCEECGAPIIDSQNYVDNNTIMCADCMEEELGEIDTEVYSRVHDEF